MEAVTVSRRLRADPAAVEAALEDVEAFLAAGGFTSVAVDGDTVDIANRVGFATLRLTLERREAEGAALAFDQTAGPFDVMRTRYLVEPADSEAVDGGAEGGRGVAGADGDEGATTGEEGNEGATTGEEGDEGATTGEEGDEGATTGEERDEGATAGEGADDGQEDLPPGVADGDAGTLVTAKTEFTLGGTIVGELLDAWVVRRQRAKELEAQLDYLASAVETE